jgi:hypothetical protein
MATPAAVRVDSSAGLPSGPRVTAPKISFIVQRFKYLAGEPSLPVEEVLGHFQDVVKAYKANPIAYARHTPKLLAALFQLYERHGASSLAFARATMNIYRFLGIVVPGGVNQLGTLDDAIARQAFQLLQTLAQEAGYEACAEVLSLLATIPSDDKPLAAGAFETSAPALSRAQQLRLLSHVVYGHVSLSAEMTQQGLLALANLLLARDAALTAAFVSPEIDGLALLHEALQFYCRDDDGDEGGAAVAVAARRAHRKDIVDVAFGLVSLLAQDDAARQTLLTTPLPAVLPTLLTAAAQLPPPEAMSVAQSVLVALSHLFAGDAAAAREAHAALATHPALLPWLAHVLQYAASAAEVASPAVQQQLLREKETTLRLACQALGQLLARSPTPTATLQAMLEAQLVTRSLRLLLQELSSAAPSVAVLQSLLRFLSLSARDAHTTALLPRWWEQFHDAQGPSLLLALQTQTDVDHAELTAAILRLVATLLPPATDADALRVWVADGLCEEACRLLHHALHVEPPPATLVAPLLQVLRQVAAADGAAGWTPLEREGARQRLADAGLPPLLRLLATSAQTSAEDALATAQLAHCFVQGDSAFGAERRRLLFTQHDLPALLLDASARQLRASPDDASATAAATATAAAEWLAALAVFARLPHGADAVAVAAAAEIRESLRTRDAALVLRQLRASPMAATWSPATLCDVDDLQRLLS